MTTTTDTLPALTVAEAAELATAEGVIAAGLRTFLDVGTALSAIRDRRLYRSDHSTFDGYCRDRWGFTDSRARQLIGAASTVTDVTVAGLPAPANEAQARELTRVPADQRALVWQQAIECSGGKPTARMVSAAADAVRRAKRIEDRGGRGDGHTCVGCVLHDRETIAHYLYDRPASGLLRYVYRDAHGVIYDRYLPRDDIEDMGGPDPISRTLPSGETYHERRQALTPCTAAAQCPVCSARRRLLPAPADILAAPDYGAYTPHPAIELFPLVPVDEFAAIVESVRRSGLIEPITIGPDGRTLVDGRIRYLACRAAGVEPRTERLGQHYTETMILDLIVSRNLIRANHTPDQRAAAMAYAEGM